jgi:hypothetical protein
VNVLPWNDALDCQSRRVTLSSVGINEKAAATACSANRCVPVSYRWMESLAMATSATPDSVPRTLDTASVADRREAFSTVRRVPEERPQETWLATAAETGPR